MSFKDDLFDSIKEKDMLISKGGIPEIIVKKGLEFYNIILENSSSKDEAISFLLAIFSSSLDFMADNSDERITMDNYVIGAMKHSQKKIEELMNK